MYYRAPRRFRSRYRRRSNGALVGVTLGAVLASGIGAKAATASHPSVHRTQATQPARVTGVTSSTETGFWTAVLADLGAPVTPADLGSLTAWAAHEGPWGSVGQFNPLDSILPMPGSWPFNTFDGNLHVQNYPDASVGAQATASTIVGFPAITAALRSGNGVCGNGLSDEFYRWSGGGYQEVC